MISVFPNISYIKRLCKNHQEEDFVELALACPSPCDPFDIVLDIISKFSTEFCFVHSVEFLVELRVGTYRKKITLFWLLTKSRMTFNCTGMIKVNVFVKHSFRKPSSTLLKFSTLE